MQFSPHSPISPRNVTDALGLRPMAFHAANARGAFDGIDFDRRPSGDYTLCERTALRVAARLVAREIGGLKTAARMRGLIDAAVCDPSIEFVALNPLGTASAAQGPAGASLRVISEAACDSRSGWTGGRTRAEIVADRRPAVGVIVLNLAEIRERIAQAAAEAEARRNSPVRHLPAPSRRRIVTVTEALAEGFTPAEIETARAGGVVERGAA